MKLKDTFFSKKQTINCKGQLIDLSSPQVMGILNITPDSFFDGGKYNTSDSIKKRAIQIEQEGAVFIDIGAYSSRPGANDLNVSEEIKRLDTALSVVKSFTPNMLVSIDTFRSEVAKWALENYRVDMINDISAGEMDNKMFETIARYSVPYIIMHMQGTPQNMQDKPHYKHLVKDILKHFAGKVKLLKESGISDVIIDPGFGFGKTLDDNYRLLTSLEDFKIFQLPVLVGISRKSMIYKHLNTEPVNALAGTIAAQTLALTKGANILRVHDVKEAAQTISIFNKCIQMEDVN